jgi:hypothetical protein
MRRVEESAIDAVYTTHTIRIVTENQAKSLGNEKPTAKVVHECGFAVAYPPNEFKWQTSAPARRSISA